jgi:hypothetical protein
VSFLLYLCCLPPRSYLVGFGFPLLILCIGAVPMNTRYLLAITIFTVAFWTSGDLPAEYVAICCLVALVVTETLTFSQAWGGAASSAVWLCFAGNALSQAVGSTNLIKIVSWKLAEHASTPFMGYVQIGVAGTISAVLIPSGIVRVLLMIPVGRSLSDSLGLNPRSGLTPTLIRTRTLTPYPLPLPLTPYPYLYSLPFTLTPYLYPLPLLPLTPYHLPLPLTIYPYPYQVLAAG